MLENRSEEQAQEEHLTEQFDLDTDITLNLISQSTDQSTKSHGLNITLPKLCLDGTGDLASVASNRNHPGLELSKPWQNAYVANTAGQTELVVSDVPTDVAGLPIPIDQNSPAENLRTASANQNFLGPINRYLPGSLSRFALNGDQSIRRDQRTMCNGARTWW